jgi:hypothetical protein
MAQPPQPPSRLPSLLKLLGLAAISSVALLAATLVFLPGTWLLLVFLFAPPTELVSIASPRDRYRVQVLYDAVWLYAPHAITIQVLDSQTRQPLAIYGTRLKNDGANLRADNAQIQWQTNHWAYLCLQGQEQAPAGLRITVPPTAPQQATIEPDALACPTILDGSQRP